MDLPDKVVELDQLRINRGINKICKCRNRKFVVDTQNRRVICQKCGSDIDPYETIHEIATNKEGLQDQVKRLLKQRKQIRNYKPRLAVIKEMEKKYSKEELIPCCPRCEEPFHFGEIKSWTGKKFGEMRIKKVKERGEND